MLTGTTQFNRNNALTLQQVQNLVQSAVPLALAPTAASVVQPMLQRIHENLPERFGRESESMKAFITQCKLFMRIQAVELSTN